ncbi:protein translocase subunit SecD [Patescibacteria group bacterium]|nr:MAG: protein translocase subunit SecD [Patescibacteria group bacterium]
MAVKISNKVSSAKKLKWHAAGVVALAIATLLIVLPAFANRGIDWLNNAANIGLPRLPDKGFNLGLDLQGGAHLVYQAKTETIPEGDRGDAVEGVRDVIERRVRGGLGVAEPLVQTTKVGGDYRVIVELPGVTDVNQAIKMIGETPILEFKEENHDPARDLTPQEKKDLDVFNSAADKKAKTALTAALKPGADFGKIAAQYSEDQASKDKGGNLGFITKEIYPEIFAWAEKAKDGQAGKTLVKSFDGLNVVKRLSGRDGEKMINASHLLVCYAGAEGCESKLNKDQARQRAGEIKAQASPANFAQLVQQYSPDKKLEVRGEELGWFKKGQMVPEFEEAAGAMPKGAVSNAVETKFGFHIIYKKDEKPSREYEVARVYVKTKQASDVVPPAEEWKSSGLSGKQLKRAEVTQDNQSGQVQVNLQFNEEGTKLFGDITTRNVGKNVAIFLDGEPISIPRVNEAITSGSAVISGSFTLGEARLLSQRLNAGALPVAVDLISQQKVDATLGSEYLRKSFFAGIVGLILVLLFMIGYYRFPGLLANVSLLVYALLSLAIFKIIGVTLTLSGIAGFILSIGMAVDANVLVFERMKEELRNGRSLLSAAEESFARAWPSIRDSNITTLISCGFLIWFGTGFVQGFAVTLAIGTLVSMFTAITVTRINIRIVFRWFNEYGNWMFLGHKKNVIASEERLPASGGKQSHT